MLTRDHGHTSKQVNLTTFKDLGISEGILKALIDLGFETPSDIQKEAIPQLIEDDHDFIGLAQTGTGKTAAFGIPLIEKIDPNNPATQALVLAPTRELGQQIAEQLVKYSKYTSKVNMLAVYGGAPIVNQIRALKSPQHIIIATPGRLIDLIKRKAVKLGNLQFLVLDEADEMLQMGFKEEIDTILTYTPEDKNVWLFSATMPDQIKRIVKKYMENPIEVRVNSGDKVNVNIEHQYCLVKRSNKSEALIRFMDVNPDMRGVVFCRTKRDTQELAEELLRKDYKADAIHGDLSQPQRDRVMKRFKSHEIHVLIATDVAARGIDVADLTHVFHYALPDDDAYYTHRAGRTGRAGKEGISVAFVSSKEEHRVLRIGKQLGIGFTKIVVPSSEDIVGQRVDKWCENLLKEGSGKVKPHLLKQAQFMLDDVTKEELIERLLKKELQGLSDGGNRDLNDKGDGRSGGGGKYRGKRDSRSRSGGGSSGGYRSRGDRYGGRGRSESGGGGDFKKKDKKFRERKNKKKY